MHPAALPSPPGLPLIGQWSAFRRDKLSLLRRVARECRDLGRLDLAGTSVIVVSSAALTQEILLDRSPAFAKMRGLGELSRPLLGDGLLSTDGEVHRRKRRLMASAFTPRGVARHAATMTDYTARHRAAWADGAVVDLASELMTLTRAIIGKVLFGEGGLDEGSSGAAALGAVMDHLIGTMRALWSAPFRWPTPANRRMKHAIAALDGLIKQAVERSAQATSTTRDALPSDVVSALLAARDEQGEGMTREHVRDELVTLILAGHETTANALAWVFDLLMAHPEAYARAEAEIDRVLGERTPTPDDLATLPFGRAVVKETLRLYPPAYLLGRVTTGAASVGGCDVGGATPVMVNVFGMHRRPDYFAEPDTFRPERFLDGAEGKIAPGAYLPFGAGPRVCIGNHFALMETQLLLTSLMQGARFERATKRPVKPLPLVTLGMKEGGLLARINKR